MQFNSDTLNLDGLVNNPMLHFGDPLRDVEQNNSPAGFAQRKLSPNALEDLYANDPICQRVCALIPSEIVRAGWDVQLMDASEAQQKKFKKVFPAYLRKMGLGRMIFQAMTWSNIYNEGAGILLDVADGQTRDKPVKLDAIRSVRPMFVLDGETLSAVRIGNATGAVDYFVDSLDYGHTRSVMGLGQYQSEAETWERGTRGPGNIVHPSRVMWFEGVPMPPRAKSRMDGSVGRLQQFWNAYQRLESAYQAMSNDLQRAQTLLMGTQGLMEMMAATGGKGGKEQLKAQLESIFYQLNNLGITAYDLKRQKFDILKRDVSNYPTAIKILKENAIAASRIGEMALFGVTNVGSGLSGQDMRDRLHLAEQVANDAETELREPLEMFLTYVMHSKEGPTKGKSPEDWVLSFKSSLTLTQSEQADLIGKMATADKTYSDMMPGLAEALILSRFGPGEWSLQTQLPNPMPKPPAPPTPPGGTPPAPEAQAEETAPEPDPEAEPEEVREEQAAESFLRDVLGE